MAKKQSNDLFKLFVGTSAQSTGEPTVHPYMQAIYATAFQDVVRQLSAALDEPSQLAANLRAKAQELNDLADLVQAVLGGDGMDDHMDDEDEEEEGEGEAGDTKGAEKPPKKG